MTCLKLGDKSSQSFCSAERREASHDGSIRDRSTIHGPPALRRWSHKNLQHPQHGSRAVHFSGSRAVHPDGAPSWKLAAITAVGDLHGSPIFSIKLGDGSSSILTGVSSDMLRAVPAQGLPHAPQHQHQRQAAGGQPQQQHPHQPHLPQQRRQQRQRQQTRQPQPLRQPQLLPCPTPGTGAGPSPRPAGPLEYSTIWRSTSTIFSDIAGPETSALPPTFYSSPLPARVATLDDGSTYGRNDIRLGVAANGAGPRTAFAEDMNILVSADGDLFATYPDGHEFSGQIERLLPGQQAKVCATAGVLICDADDNIIYRGGPPWEITVLSGSSHYVTWDGDGNIHIREVDHLPLTHLGLCDMSDSDMFGSSSDDDESEDSDDDLSSDDDE